MDPILLLILMVILLALPIWTTFRQNKQLRQIREMQARLGVGAEVLTGSGQHGIVVAVDDKTVDLEIAEGIVTRWERAAIVRNVDEENAKADNAAGVAAAEAPATSDAPETRTVSDSTDESAFGGTTDGTGRTS
ncbi:preprotein translocase subunit YajC [uncultured Corynebacterium sp.]|uniref:preprotein translocase subunit YajC n=1 Tax=uncultured Corynebacterium sp. TaxID=159447 RepID=UPI0025D5CF46|nr:preprotein translocase subunit YajC [uncultured Corynebacterium sp.]